jgi:hypothetical protein
MKLLRIPPEQISQRWGQISPFLADVLKYATDDFTLDQMKVYLTSGQWLTLGVFDEELLKGVIAVSFTNMPNDRVAFITAIGGKNITNSDTFNQFKTILKAHGATKIQGGVRESVARLWRRLDFKQRQILVEFKL